jgi:hypothetical protein
MSRLSYASPTPLLRLSHASPTPLSYSHSKGGQAPFRT